MLSNDPKKECTAAGGDTHAVQAVTSGSTPASNQCNALIDGKLTKAMLSLIKRKQLSDSEILQFREPLLTRMRAGLLTEESLQSFITYAAQGGIPLIDRQIDYIFTY
jgi:hypothetical protein